MNQKMEGLKKKKLSAYKSHINQTVDCIDSLENQIGLMKKQKAFLQDKFEEAKEGMFYINTSVYSYVHIEFGLHFGTHEKEKILELREERHELPWQVQALADYIERAIWPLEFGMKKQFVEDLLSNDVIFNWSEPFTYGPSTGFESDPNKAYQLELAVIKNWKEQ